MKLRNSYNKSWAYCSLLGLIFFLKYPCAQCIKATFPQADYSAMYYITDAFI